MSDRGVPTCLVLEPGGTTRVLASSSLDDISKLRAERDTIVWLDIADPQDDDIGLLQREFDLHPLAVEDLRTRRQRVKIDTYPNLHVVVAYETRKPRRGRSFELGELHLIAAPDSLVSIHWGASPSIEDVRQRVGQGASSVGHSVGGVLYAILDTVVDGYFPLLDRLSDRIDRLEDRIVSGQQGGTTLRDVLAIKRELLELRRVLAPQRDVANALLRRDVALIDDRAAPYFQDLYDHLVRVLDQLDLYRDLIGSTLDANLSVTSNNLNEVMKRLTAFTVVIMLPTLIASIYGMNFRGMPGLDSPLGFWMSIGAMVLLGALAAAYFRARDWF
ncbi:MAG TPA: magnesium/cobalt transporter CorA [Candidatus Limnocylindria bacterium]|nr:magnesium/cobalt transporter CorA [Candidatus Limnocylindria bacterium]